MNQPSPKKKKRETERAEYNAEKDEGLRQAAERANDYLLAGMIGRYRGFGGHLRTIIDGIRVLFSAPSEPESLANAQGL